MNGTDTGKEGFKHVGINLTGQQFEDLTTINLQMQIHLAQLLRYGLTRVIDGKKTVQQAVQEMYEVLERNGFADLCESYVPCGLAKPRMQELYACLNRFRGGM